MGFIEYFSQICFRFLVDSASSLQQHLATEGLFRKSGSIQRQKILKVRISK